MIEKYKNWLLVNGASTLTVKNYMGKLKKFLKVVKVKEINEEKIAKFLLELGENQKASTVNIYRAIIKSFLIFLKKDISIPDQLKLEQKLPDSITEEFFIKEVIPVVECIFTNPLKIKAIMYFIFYTGARRGELKHLKREHIDLTSRTVKIYGKGKKERIVFFDERTAEILQSYFTTEPEIINAFNIRDKALEKVFEKVKPHFKNINFRPHLLRHSFATMFINNGGDSAVLKRLMGHSSITTTERYIGVETTKLKEIYDKTIGGKK